MLRGDEALKGKIEVCEVGVGIGLAHTGAHTGCQPVGQCWLEVVGGEVGCRRGAADAAVVSCRL